VVLCVCVCVRVCACVCVCVCVSYYAWYFQGFNTSNKPHRQIKLSSIMLNLRLV